MATHVVCPMCGKSTSLTAFPVKGEALTLQTFRGLGRGRGFTVEAQSDGMGSAELRDAVKGKATGILRMLATHGHLRVEDLDAIVANTSARVAEKARQDVAAKELHARIELLERELDYERKERSMLAEEITDVRAVWRADRQQLHSATNRTAVLEQKLDRLRWACDQLVAASRTCVSDLRQLRENVRASSDGTGTLTAFVRDFREVAALIQELRAISVVQNLSGATSPQAR